mmetsp:Transcript_12414/g.39986  ORF Transcript_12414/g.39986 Transcript_12414/m.39986 type:complete len:401 (-) Transcript_12414:506-1708(-)
MVQRSRRGRRRACCTARCSAARSLRPGRRHAAPEPVARVEGRIGRRHDVRACAPCHASEAVRVRSKLRVRPIRCPVPGHVPGRVHGHVPGHVLGHVRRGLGLFWREDKRAPGQICAARAASSAGAHRVQVACGEALLQLRVGAAGWRGSGERATAARELGAGVGAGHWRAWGRGRSRERPGRPAHRARRCNTRGGLEGRTRVGVGRRRRRSRRLCSRCSPCGPTARKHPLAAYLPSLGLAPVAAAPAECRLPLAYRRLAACPAVLAGAPVAPPQPHQPHPSLDAAPEPERAPLSPPPRRHPAPASHAPPHARASRARRRGSPPARPPRLRLFLAALLAALLPTGQPAAACPRVQPALHPAATAARPDSLHRKVRLRPGRPHGPRGRTAARAASRLVVAPA